MLQKAGSGVKGKVGARRGGQKPNLHRRGRGVRRGNQAVDISWENICEECFLPLIERVLFREKMEKVEVPPLPPPSPSLAWPGVRQNAFHNLHRYQLQHEPLDNLKHKTFFTASAPVAPPPPTPSPFT